MKKTLIIGGILVLVFDAFWIAKYSKEGTSAENWTAFITANILTAGLAYFKGVKGK